MSLLQKLLMKISHSLNFHIRKHPFKGAYRLLTFLANKLTPPPENV